MPAILVSNPAGNLVRTVEKLVAPNGSTSTTSYNVASSAFRLEKTWAVTPNYRVLRAKHALPMNAYHIKRSQTWKGYAWYKTVPKDKTSSTLFVEGIPQGEYDALFFPSSFPSASALADIRAACELKILLEIKQQKVNLAQAYAERHRTAEMIAKTIQRFVNAFKALRRGNVEEALRHLGAGPLSRRRQKRVNAILRRRNARPPEGEFENASNLWLEIQYGWRPLMNDIYESAQEIVRAQTRSPPKTKAHASIVRSFNAMLKDNGSATDKTYHTAKDTIRVKGTMDVWFSAPDVPRILTELGFTNPAYLAWELTPFSFVVDWFIPIGNSINAFDATVGLSFEKGCYGVKIDYYRRSMSIGKTSTFHVTTGEAVVTEQIKQFDRSVITSFPKVPVPRFKNPFSAEHMLNALALLIQTFKPTGGHPPISSF